MLNSILFSHLKKSGTLQLFSSRFIVQVTTILQSIIVSRILGPEGKGLFTEITLWPTIIASFSMLGLYTGIVRISAKKNISKKYNITKGVIQVTVLTGFIGFLVTFFINYKIPYNQDVKTAALIFSLYILIYNLNRGLSAINNGRQDLGVYSISAAILNPAFFIIIIFLSLVGRVSISSLLYALLFANISSLAFLIFKNKEWRNSICAFPQSKILKYSLKFSFADFAEPIYLYYDKALIAVFLSPFDLGIYTIAFSAASVINILSQTFSIKLFSDVANGKEKTIAKQLRINVLLTTIASAFLAPMFPFIIPFFFGMEFKPAIIPSAILLITCIIQGQANIIERCILAKGYPFVGIQAKCITMASFALLLGVCAIFKSISVNAAALITIITQSLYLVYITSRFKHIFKERLHFLPKREDVCDLIKLIMDRR